MSPKVDHRGVRVNSYHHLSLTWVWRKSGNVVVVVGHADARFAVRMMDQTYWLRFTFEVIRIQLIGQSGWLQRDSFLKRQRLGNKIVWICRILADQRSV